MSDKSNPWALLTGTVTPPPWTGGTIVHELPPIPDDDDDSEGPPIIIHSLPPAGTLKMCSKCKVVKLADLENFYAASDSKDGLRSACKPCCREMPSMKNTAQKQRERRAKKRRNG